MDDVYDLERFVAAQDAGDTYDAAVAELRAGQKESHWMWFIFPQVAGLGFSVTSRRYAISGLDEAGAYLYHLVLGPRLAECTRLVVSCGRTAEHIFGPVDALKLRSSMTLFARAAPDGSVFAQVLDQCFDGQPDPETARLL